MTVALLPTRCPLRCRLTSKPGGLPVQLARRHVRRRGARSADRAAEPGAQAVFDSSQLKTKFIQIDMSDNLVVERYTYTIIKHL